MSEIWEEIADWTREGKEGVVVTVAGVRGSCPGERGSKMLVGSGGWVAGTVGGGKIEARAVEEAAAMLAGAEKTKQAVWNLQRDIGMTCGGEMTLWFERLEARSRWRVAIFGAGHVGQALARIMIFQKCDLLAVDPRREWLERLPQGGNLERVCPGRYEEAVAKLKPGDQVLCVTMGHGTDVPVLEALAKSGLELGFVGVIGSRAKRKVLERELRERGVGDDWLGAMHCPVGLPIGGDAPEEIALSIAAQLLQCRGGGKG